VLGHEAAGTVDEIGPEVSGVAVGDRVVLNWSPACRACAACLRGEPWLCSVAERNPIARRGALTDGTPVNIALGVGGLAERVVVDQNAIVPLPDGVALQPAALLGCAVLTGTGAVLRTAGVKPGESVLVMGLGGVGLSTIAGAKLAGAGPIIAVDVNLDKADLARRLGATDVLVSDENLPKAVRALTNKQGVDHAFECVGRSTTIRLAWQTTRRGGTTTIVGLGSAEDKVEFSALELFHFARTLTASVYGSSDPVRDLPALAEHVKAGNLDIDAMVTHRITLDEVGEAFERMERGSGARSLVILDPAAE
jgi:S-(hydroxymethyl)glutathione dehydrogenase / alcohol dehydrogenase